MPEDIIKLGEHEYTQEELNELVGYGSKYKEFQEKFDTDPEKAWRSYGQVTQELKDYKSKAARLDEVEKELRTIKNQSPQGRDGAYSEEQIRAAKAELKKLDVVTKEDMADLLKEYGFVKADEVGRKVDQTLATRDLVKQFDELEGKYDGKDGRPKFDKETMVSYMERNGLSDPEKAYNLKFQEELAEYRAQKIIEAKYPQMVTGTKGGGKKEPQRITVTKDNMKQLLQEKIRGQKLNFD